MNIKFKKYWRKTSLKQRGAGDFFLQHVFQISCFKCKSEPTPYELAWFDSRDDTKVWLLWETSKTCLLPS